MDSIEYLQLTGSILRMTEAETFSFWLGASQITVGALALIVAGVGFFEYTKVRKLRKELASLKESIPRLIFRGQQAQQRIIASYNDKLSTAEKVSLIKQAIEIDPSTFNAYNALGYALLDGGDQDGAIASFIQATVRHPEEKAGYFDLAYVYISKKRLDLAKEALCKAVSVDKTAQEDIDQQPALKALF